MAVTTEDIALWRGWIGRTETSAETLDEGAARRYAAALGAPLDVAAAPPPLMHWAFFLPAAPADGLGPDGHPKRGGFMPPISLPRRMFAAAEMSFVKPPRLGDAATLTAEIKDVSHKAGKSGDLVFVEVLRTLAQGGAVCVTEKQTIVYRPAGGPVAAAADDFAGGDMECWRPSTVDLFRFSAATFNSHRIHYDLPYAKGEEGYPGLVVQGPFIAARLFKAAQARAQAPLKGFSFRAEAPAFADQPLYLAAGEGPREVKAIRCDGVVAMRATWTA